MKVFALVVLAVASVSARGSGPYLPSGWKPQGPAFYLPSETEKPQVQENPLKDLILQGSEASGSDFLREYGPPKVQEVSQDLTNQGLPDVVTEQAFGIILLNQDSQIALDTQAVEEAKIEETLQTEAVTESQVEEDKTTLSAEVPILEIERIVESSQTTVANDVETTNINVEITQFESVATSEGSTENVETNQQSASSNAEEVSQKVAVEVEAVTVEAKVASEPSQESVEESYSTQQELVSTSEAQFSTDSTEKAEVTEELIASVKNQQSNENVIAQSPVQNIPDIIASLENEIYSQQVAISQAVGDVTSLKEVSGELAQAPEGFLEYGPPGFTEYGPPKGDQLRADEGKSEDLSYETNETRRRRFSPKFSSSKKH